MRSTLSLSMTSDKGGSEKRITATMVLVGAMSKPPCSLVICSTVVPVDCILVFIPGQNVEDVRNQDYWLVSQSDAYCHTSSNFSSMKKTIAPKLELTMQIFFMSAYVFWFMRTYPFMRNWKNCGENAYILNMRQLQMFQKVESGGGPIFKVVLEC